MRPYLAIISDSFRAAFASRVLWIVLAGILLFLAALAPVGYREVYRTEFDGGDINSAERLTAMLARALADDTPSAARRIAEALPEDLQTEIVAAAKTGEDVPRRSRYAAAFNVLVQQDRWYDEPLWENLRFGELRELERMNEGTMDELLRQRRNQLRLEVALPGAFRGRPERAIQFTYAVFTMPAELPIRRQQLIDLLNQTLLPLVLNYLFGIGAVFVGILVTSPIIPEMLQPGSLHLLLSKPVSRSALYLSKFVGGCAFVLLCETLLVSGLWLIVGTRFGIWNQRLFYCIPVFVFLFAVYYSVSALAALRWRSAIVSVVLTILFWTGCFLVGVTGDGFDAWIRDPARVQSLAAQQGTLFVSTAAGELNRLSPQDAAYQSVIANRFGQPRRILGPTRIGTDRVVAASAEFNPFVAFGASETSLRVFDADSDWVEQPGLKLPRGTTDLVGTPDGLLAITGSGLWYAPSDALAVNPEAEEEKDSPSGGGGLFAGITRLLTGNAHGFTDVLPSDVAFASPNAVAVVQSSGDLVVYSAGTLQWLTKSASGPTWSPTARVLLDGDQSLPTWIAADAEHVVVAREEEPLRIFGGGDLRAQGEVSLRDADPVTSLIASPSGNHFLARLANRRVWQIEWAAGQDPSGDATVKRAPYPGQGEIEALAWADDGPLWLAHDIDRLTQVEADSGQVLAARSPRRDLWRNIDAYVVRPLRSVTPQTHEISETVVALISGRTSRQVEFPGQTIQEQLDVTRPLVTCGVFTFLMLLLGSVYFARQDF